MSHEDETKRQLCEIQRMAERKMAEIQHNLAPAQPEILSPEELAAQVSEQLRAAGPDQLHILSIKTAVAVADLMDLGDSLKRQMDQVSHELRRVQGHGSAVAAYGRWLGALPAAHRH